MRSPARVTAPPAILVVDDDAAVRGVFATALAGAGYEVRQAPDGTAGLEQWQMTPPDLILLDVEMPRLDGWQTLRELRRLGCTLPILMITHESATASRIQGLDAGADDYLCKPCDVHELLARVRALLRRASGRTGAAGPILRFDGVVVDLARRSAEREGRPVRLSPTDYRLLAMLQERLGNPVPREEIMQRLWDAKVDATHALETHIWRLRKKLGDTGAEARWLRHVSGVGYMLVPEVVEGARASDANHGAETA